jgi:hypothetical protein
MSFRRPIAPGTPRTLARWVCGVTVAGLVAVAVWATVEWSVAADRVRRADVEAREGHLYRQISAGGAVLESQRRIYIERIRKLEADLWGKDQEIAALRMRAAQATQAASGLPR